MRIQIIKCPNCDSLFKLHQKPPKTFCCPKCQYSVPFDQILNTDDSKVTQSDGSSVQRDADLTNTVGEATKVVNFGEKTKLVPGFQRQEINTAVLSIVYKGVFIGKVALPQSGNFNLGRRSSDSTAHIKIAPDMAMSRVHAAMRTVKTNDGKTIYQITTIKPENPVYVNGLEIGKGKIHSLKPGDRILLGETVLTFKFD